MNASNGTSKAITNEATGMDTFKVSDIKNQNFPRRFSGSYTYDDLKTDGPIAARWQVQPETAGLSIRGALQGVMEQECARCLNPYQVPVSLEINEQYVFDSYIDPYEREKQLTETDFFEVVDEQGEIDLKDLAHQFLVLESANHATCEQPECAMISAGND